MSYNHYVAVLHTTDSYTGGKVNSSLIMNKYGSKLITLICFDVF